MWFARENIKDIRKVAQIIRVFCAHCSGQAFAQGFSTRVSQAGALLGKKTLKQLNRAWVSEMRELYDSGIEAGISMAPMFLKSMSRDPRHEPQRLTTVF